MKKDASNESEEADAEGARPPGDLRVLGIVSACFFLSGAAGLIYQLVWMRYLSTVFGTSELAIVTVLVAYMGGLATGAWCASRWLGRLRRPILAYAILEAAIALSALLVPLVLKLVANLHGAILGSQPAPPSDGGIVESLAYLALGCAVLIVPTACMGATLPILAKGMVRRSKHIGRRIGWLYSLNTFGAVAGVIAGAFFLIPSIGLWRTSFVGVALNIIVAVAGWGIARNVRTPDAEMEPVAVDDGPAPSQRFASVVLVVMLLSGAVSFAYEILWTRLLAHILGGSLYAFATMLAAFLGGIAIGGLLGSRLATSRRRSVFWLAVAEIATGLATVALFAYVGSAALASFAGTLGAQAGLCALVLMPATICLGATFPLAVRSLTEDPAAAGKLAGRVYSWNTAGAILGAIGAGYFLIPALGFAVTFKWAIVLNLLLGTGVLLFFDLRSRKLAIGGGVIAGLVVIAYWPQPPIDLLSRSPLQKSSDAARPKMLHHAVGRSATVAVLERQGSYLLRTNGLPEAEIFPKGAEKLSYTRIRWLPALPKVLRPETRDMLVVGFGGGALLEAVPAGIGSIDVIELEPEVIAANRLLAEKRAIDPLKDPRLNVIVNDARGALKLTEKRYDAIVSQPSHPWTAGASHLYTREFLEIAREHLNPGGVFVQWLGAHFVDETLFRSFCATMLSTFPHTQLFLVGDNFLFVGSETSLEENYLSGAREDGSIYHLSGYPKLGFAEDVFAALQADEAGCRKLADGYEPITDDRNLMATHHSPGGSGLEGAMDERETMLRVIGPVHFLNQASRPLLDARPAGTFDYVYFAKLLRAIPGCADIARVRDEIVPKADRFVLDAYWTMSRDPQRALDFLGAVSVLEQDHPTAGYLEAKIRSGLALKSWKRTRSDIALPGEFSEFVAQDSALAAAIANLPAGQKQIIEAEYWSVTNQLDRLREIDAQLREISDHRSATFLAATQVRLRHLLDPSGKSAEQLATDRQAALDLIDQLMALPQSNNVSLMTQRIPLAQEAGDTDFLIAAGWILGRKFASRPAGTPGNIQAAVQNLVGRIFAPYVKQRSSGEVRIADPKMEQFYFDLIDSVGVEVLPAELRPKK